MTGEESPVPIDRAVAVVSGGPAAFGMIALLSGHVEIAAIVLIPTVAALTAVANRNRHWLRCWLQGHDWNVVEYEREMPVQYAWCDRCGEEREKLGAFDVGIKDFPEEELYD